MADFKQIFLKKFIERDLQQYALINNIKKTRGHFLICIDNSGSMSGTPIIQAKSFAVGILERARKENRSFYAIDFSGPGEVRAWEFTNGECSPDDLVDYAGYMHGGGTCFNTALRACMDFIDKKLPDSHIIFITDGNDHVSEDVLKAVNKWREEADVMIHGMLVHCYHADKSELSKFCDSVRLMTDMDNKFDNYAEEIFLTI